VAFVGAAFFAGNLAAWALARSGWPRSLRWLGRLGAAASLGFLVLALQQGTPCPFCIAAQLANLAFVLLCSERSSGPARARGPEAAFVLAALGVTLLLALGRSRAEATRGAAAERALAESTRAVEEESGARAFTGRYRRGPARAALRLVVFTDYQCPDCARVEQEAWALLEERGDLSLSVKHFPLCKDCNRRARALGQNPHPNACWAARAAEAAGLVGGDEAFWRMHRWLFERKGAFTDAELLAGLAELGLEAGAFLETLHGTETLARVQADVEEGLALGIATTPLVFLNGVELRGWQAPEALRRAVLALAASAPAASGAEADRPPDALEKGLADWRGEPRVSLPARAGEELASGAPEVVLWGDYLDPSTRELDRALRALLAAHPGVRASFRHYPLDPECVPSAPDRHPGACRAARAAEAARRLAGEAGFERFHAWLMEARPPLGASELSAGARRAGLDPAAFDEALASEAVRAAVQADVEGARRLGIHSIPLLYVGGKRVPRWRVEGTPLLERLLDEALRSR
jgi:protein-disulfide isomerase